MSLETIAQKKNCGGDGLGANTGKLGCLVELSSPEHVVKMPKSFVIPKETNFNLAYIRQQVQLGNFTPVLGASAFEDVSSEDSYNTNSSGEKRLNLKGLPEHRLMFEEGHEFYKQMAKLEGYKDSRFAIIDDEGNWAMARNSNGDYTGFQAGHVTPEMRKSKVKGGDSEMKPLLIQYINRREWDEDYDVFLSENLDFATEDIPTVNGVNLAFNSVPTDTDTTIELTAVLASDNNTNVEGLSQASFLVTVNGSTVAVSGLAEASNVYTLTIPAVATNDAITVQLYDSSVNKNIVDENEILYRSNVASTQAVV